MKLRPRPPLTILDEVIRAVFAPAEDMAAWAQSTFLAEDALLPNPDHDHLRAASIGWLWTNEANVRAGRVVLGQAEKMPPMAMGKWARGRAVFQVEEWFGDIPDFLITLHGPRCVELDDASFLALVEHELYHCGQERDVFGSPKFNKAGTPVWTLRGHDVEEFVGVVRRYGSDAAGVRELVDAAARPPEVGAAKIANACGNCLRAVA